MVHFARFVQVAVGVIGLVGLGVQLEPVAVVVAVVIGVGVAVAKKIEPRHLGQHGLLGSHFRLEAYPPHGQSRFEFC